MIFFLFLKNWTQFHSSNPIQRVIDNGEPFSLCIPVCVFLPPKYKNKILRLSRATIIDLPIIVNQAITMYLRVLMIMCSIKRRKHYFIYATHCPFFVCVFSIEIAKIFFMCRLNKDLDWITTHKSIKNNRQELKNIRIIFIVRLKFKLHKMLFICRRGRFVSFMLQYDVEIHCFHLQLSFICGIINVFFWP